MFGRKIRNLNRYREIAVTLARHGFGFFIDETGWITKLSLPRRSIQDAPKADPASLGERIRHVLEELGPTFVKLGQAAGTRTDLLPEEVIRELEKLHDEVPPVPFSRIREVLEKEIGPISRHFKEFEATPIAAASIGQVHKAVLHNGETVAVKVQRPDIAAVIKTDLNILRDLAASAEQRWEWAVQHQLGEVVKELARTVLRELDYTREGRNTDRIAGRLADDPHIRIPKVYWHLTTKKVLTQEYIHGIKLNHPKTLDDMGLDRKILAERLVKAIFRQILFDGFFHGDPHPGNLFAQSGNKIALIDFGMVGRLTPEMQEHFSSLIIAMMQRNTDGVVRSVLRMGIVPDDVDRGQLWLDMDELTDKYVDVPLSEVSLAEAVNDLFDVAYRHRIRIPSDFTLLGKTLLTLEGVAHKLDPQLKITKVTQPFGKQLLKERYSPRHMAEHVWRNLYDYGEVLLDLPKQLKELSESLKRGTVRVEIGVPRLHVFLRKLDQIVNRLSYSIVLLSFSIIMAGLIIGSSLTRQQTLLWKVPAIEIGLIIAVFMLFWLIYSIFKSGRL